MKSLGLQPTDTGRPGGREIGDHMTHYIVDGGPFAEHAAQLIAAGFAIAWREAPPEEQVDGDEGEDEGAGSSAAEFRAPERKQRKSGVRVRYTCPACGLNAWAKHDVELICGQDHLPLTPSG